IREGNRFYEHIVGRTLNSMEIIFLTTGESICNSSATVIFLPTDPPSLRSKAILPIQAILQNPDNPYYPDALEKYFQRPHGQEFDNILYEEYYQKYNICPPNARVPNNSTRDLHGRIIVRRHKQILTRKRYTKITDGERYFYNRLLQIRAWRSEDE